MDDHDIYPEAHIDFSKDLNLKVVTEIVDSISCYLKKSYHIAHMTLQAEYDKDGDKKLVCKGS